MREWGTSFKPNFTITVNDTTLMQLPLSTIFYSSYLRNDVEYCRSSPVVFLLWLRQSVPNNG